MFKSKRFWFLILFIGIFVTWISCSMQTSITASKSYTRIPVRFFPLLNIPHIKIEIENSSYSLLVDLGSGSHFDLKKSCVEKIKNKQFTGNATSYDIKGKDYSLHSFRVSKIKFPNLNICDAVLNEESIEFLATGGLIWPLNTLSAKLKKKINMYCTDGRIGWGVFKNFDCFFDFPRSVFFLGQDMSTLINEAGCSLDGFVKIPFSIENYGIVLSLETELGTKRFLLDTGATHSALRESQVDKMKAAQFAPGRWLHTCQLMASGQDFGAWPFVLFEFSDLFACDGILGIDFFNEHAIALDFHNQIAYFQPPGVGPGRWERFVCWFKSAFCC